MYSAIFLFFIRVQMYFPRSDPVFYVLLYGSIAVKALALTNLIGITMYSAIFLFFIRVQMYFPRSDPVFYVLLYGSIAVKALALTNLVLGGIMYKKIVRIVNDIVQIDETLSELGINVKHWKVWMQCLLGVVIGGTSLCYLLYESYTAYQLLACTMGYIVLIAASFSSTAPLAINGAVLHQYSLYCRIIEVRYSAIHVYLKSILKNCSENCDEDVFDSIQPFYIMAHLSGVVFFSLIKTGSTGGRRYGMTCFSTIKYVLGLLFYAVLFAYFGNLQMKMTSSGLAPTVTSYANIAVKMLAMINMSLELIFSKEMVQIVNGNDEINKMLLGIDINSNQS
ncbi:hypothetical protein QE152_g22338 [Popillia japonica]|uniref:Gustatory receptor n=1 Tax=Popillia japonica TaxID=7064 RepID=A0AAW1KL30_POPJA